MRNRSFNRVFYRDNTIVSVVFFHFRKNIADIFIAKHRNGPTGKIELYFNESQASFRNLERHFEE